MDKLIGYLTPQGSHYAVVGECCKEQRRRESPVFEVNVLPYRQNCVCCGKVLVQGRTPSWPELFTGGTVPAG